MIFNFNLLGACVVALALAALLWQVATRKTVRVAIIGAVAGMLGGVFFLLDSPRFTLADLTGIADAGRLTAHISVLFAGYCSQIIFVGKDHDGHTRSRRNRKQLAVFATGAALLTACVAADPHAHFEARWAQRPAVAAYLLIFLAFVGYWVISIAMQSHQRVKHLKQAHTPKSTSTRYLIIGLRTLSFAGPVGGTYVAGKVLYLILALLDITPPISEVAVNSVVANLAVLLAVAGVTIPLFGPPIENTGRTLWAWRTHRRLHPLWNAVAQRQNLHLPTGWTRLRQAQLQLHVRIAEIHDGLWTLRRWMPDGHLPDNPTHAATAIAIALATRAAGHPASAEASTAAERPNTTTSEASWLAQVADAYRTSPRPPSIPTPDRGEATQSHL